MRTSKVLVSVAAALAFTAATAAPSHAARLTTPDPVGDTQHKANGAWTPAPNNALGDITAIRVVNNRAGVTIALTVREFGGTTAGLPAHYDIYAQPTIGSRQLWAGVDFTNASAKPTVKTGFQVKGNWKRTTCGGVTVSGNQLIANFPRRCFGKLAPKAVQAAAEARVVANANNPSEEFRDSAYVNGSSNSLTLGPRVKR